MPHLAKPLTPDTNKGNESTGNLTLSIGLSPDGLRSKFPYDYLKDTLAPLLVSPRLCAEFIRVIFTTPQSLDNARKEWAQHAQTVNFQHLSVKRSSQYEDKMKAVRNIRHFGFIVYDSIVEVWEMVWQRNPDTDSKVFQFFPSCQIHALGRLDVSRVDDVALFREFINIVTRWGLGKCCMAYADNLHRRCWLSNRSHSDPSRMDSIETKKYWSS